MRAITLRILCEGPTESNFATQILKPYLAARSVFIRPEPLMKGHYGIVPYEKLRKAIQADVGRSREHEYVTTMVDLYRLGRYPGVDKLASESPYDRVQRIENEMAIGLPNDRFIPYVQLHEFEAFVFVDLDRLPGQFSDGEANNAPAKLRKSVGDVKPELVNDGELTAPSKRIIREVHAYANVKPVAGPAIAGEIGLPKLRETCPHFDEWLSRLECLAEHRVG